MQAALERAEWFIGKEFGDYEIQQLLGQGQWNAVYQAQQRSKQCSVLLTLFFLPTTFAPEARQRFMQRLQREGSSLIKLQHPHILSPLASGEQGGYPYLITPFVQGNSLAHILKEAGPFTAAWALEVLAPLADALDYAHRQGIMHGALSLAHVLIDETQTLRITSFGLNRLAALQGFEEHAHPYAHLLSIGGTPLTALEYMAPEVVKGQPVDARADVYAVGLMLFELLCGTLPFSGPNPLAIAAQHVQQRVPEPSTVNAAVPSVLDHAVRQATVRDPTRRFQSVVELARSFEQAMYMQETASVPSNNPLSTDVFPAFDSTLIEQNSVGMAQAQSSWQLLPPIVTNHLPALSPAGTTKVVDTGKNVIPELTRNQLAGPAAETYSSRDENVDPFDWWTGKMVAQPPTAGSAPSAFVPAVGSFSSQPGQPRKVARKGRRRVVALLATGGLVAAGAVIVGGVSLAHMLGSTKSATTANVGRTPTSVARAQATPTPTQAAPTPTQAPPTPTQAAPTPTQAPQPTPTPMKKIAPTPPPAPSGPVIGSTGIAANTAKNFSNPADNNGSILIHLSNGNFVAYESACTHAGVTVDYDPMSRMLVCPAHGAIFDPAQNASVTQGPATQSLKSVAIHVNADGTITAG